MAKTPPQEFWCPLNFSYEEELHIGQSFADCFQKLYDSMEKKGYKAFSIDFVLSNNQYMTGAIRALARPRSDS